MATTTTKLMPGGRLPELTLPVVGGGTFTLGRAASKGNWQVVIVYRGRH